MCSKDVSNLQLRARQRPCRSLRPSALQLRQQLVGAVGVADQLGRHMGVLRGGAELGVTEQNLDHAHVGSRLKQMRCKAVAQTMQRAARLLDPGQVLRRAEGAMQLPRRQRVDPGLPGKSQPSGRASRQ